MRQHAPSPASQEIFLFCRIDRKLQRSVSRDFGTRRTVRIVLLDALGHHVGIQALNSINHLATDQFLLARHGPDEFFPRLSSQGYVQLRDMRWVAQTCPPKMALCSRMGKPF